jgi:hypothetical protein
MSKKIFLYILGSAMVIVGVSRILAWWDDLAMLVRGSAGILLAVGGLLVLYSLKNK